MTWFVIAAGCGWAVWIGVYFWLKRKTKARIVFITGVKGMNPITALTIVQGASTHVTAIALDQNGQPMNPQPAISFVIAPPSAASFTADVAPANGGNVTGLAAGSAVLQASAGSVTANLAVNVTAPPPPPQTLTSIVFTSP